MNRELFDAIVIGAGPAGLSCALDLHESKISYIVLERHQDLGGQLKDIENTIRDFAGGFFNNGGELKQKMSDLCRQVDLKIAFNCQTESIDVSRKIIVCNGVQYQAQAIVMATGRRVRKLVIPGIASAPVDVFYHSEHNLDKLEGKHIAIIGGGDNALMDALVLADKVPCIYVIHRNHELKARADVVRLVKSHGHIKLLLNHELSDVISREGRLQGISIFDRTACLNHTVEVERLLIRAGTAPNTDQVKGQVRMDEGGHIYIDQWCSTSTPGFYALGDITSPGYQRLATAIGHGSIAALAIRTSHKAASPA